MKIQELIDNKEFSFNPHFKIYQYVPADGEEGECILKYDSFSSEDIAYGVLLEDISAINQADDGTVEIEYI